jgi:hypothetical protein
MKRLFFLLLVMVSVSINANAQRKADSLAVTKTFNALLQACKAGDGAKASLYILNTRSESDRAYKTFADYSDPNDKEAVDKWMKVINRDILGAQQYQVKMYVTNKESEGVWHILMLSCKANGKTYTIGAAFLKVGDKFGLGDLD